MCRSLRRTQAAGAYTKWAWRSLCSDGLVHFSRCSNGMLVFHESHGFCGHPKNGFLIHQFEWMVSQVEASTDSRVPGRTPQAAGSIISLGRWVCPGFWEVFWWGNLGKPWRQRTEFFIFCKIFLNSFFKLASTQLFEFDLTWLDFFSILFFGGCT